MSLSKIVLGIATKISPMLTAVFPQRLLSAAKAKMISKMANELKNTEMVPFEPNKYPKGINLAGCIKSDTGLGQSMRLLANIIENSSWEYTVYNYFVPPGGSMNNSDFDGKISQRFRYNINIIHVNASEFPLAFSNIGKNQWDYRYTIGYWLWELEEFPEEWHPSFNLLDEIWTPSDFITNTLKKYTNKPVRTIPYSVTAPINQKFDRKYFSLPENMFLFLMMFNSRSGMERKNPLGVIEAFKKAFGKEQKDVGIIVKIDKWEQSKNDIEYVRRLLDGYDNIYFITETLTKVEVNSLIACADVFVSLHRAEGFGLVMAEAMLVGTPVIATNWSANTEFMNNDTSCMVDYKIIPLKKDIPPFKKGYHWADADICQAAAYMERLYEDQVFYEEKKSRATKYIREKLGMQHVVSVMEDRLREIIGEHQ